MLPQTTTAMTSSTSSSDAARAYGQPPPQDPAMGPRAGLDPTAAHPSSRGERHSRLRGDVLISASTAAGKTEAAFLPILTRVADRASPGLSRALRQPAQGADQRPVPPARHALPAYRMPGRPLARGAPQSAKTRITKNARGIALITPESIESDVRARPGRTSASSSPPSTFIVVDEVHAFMHGPRGLHLSSLLKRIDAASRKACPPRGPVRHHRRPSISPPDGCDPSPLRPSQYWTTPAKEST